MYLNTHPTEPYGERGLYLYEPLPTTAPADASPYCYHFNRIVFRKTPLRIGTDSTYEKWDEVSSAWDLLGQRWTDADIGWAALAPFVNVGGTIYELASAQVLWHDGWVLRWLAWRVREDDQRLIEARRHGAN
jgi:hypothetical protein